MSILVSLSFLWLMQVVSSSSNLAASLPTKILVCSTCDNRATPVKYPKPLVRVNCNISQLTCKCSNSKCVKQPKFILYYCDASRFYKTERDVIKLQKTCGHMKCMHPIVRAVTKNQAALYPLMYQGMLYPGMFKTARMKAPLVKAKMKKKEYCWQIEPKGSYVLVPEKTTENSRPTSKRMNFRGTTQKARKQSANAVGVKTRATAKGRRRKATDSVRRKPMHVKAGIMKTNKNKMPKTTKAARRTNGKKPRRTSTSRKMKRNSPRTTDRSKLGRKVHAGASRSKKWSAMSMKAAKGSKQSRKATSKPKHQVTGKTRTMKETRTTKRLPRSSRILRTKKRKRISTKFMKSTSKRTRQSTRMSVPKLRNSTSKKMRKSTKRSKSSTGGREKHGSRNQTKKWTTRKPRRPISGKGAKSSKCKGNGTKKCDEPLHKATGYVSSGCVPENHTPTCHEQEYNTFNGCKVPDQHVTVNASCSGCLNREEFVSLADRFECTMTQDACKCETDTCRVPEAMEYVYVAYCAGQSDQQINGYLEKCRLAGCPGGVQARSDHRDYFLLHNGQKLVRGGMRYRGQRKTRLDQDYTVAEFCSKHLKPAGYTLFRSPSPCRAQQPAYQWETVKQAERTITTMYLTCSECAGNSREEEVKRPSTVISVPCNVQEFKCSCHDDKCPLEPYYYKLCDVEHVPNETYQTYVRACANERCGGMQASSIAFGKPMYPLQRGYYVIHPGLFDTDQATMMLHPLAETYTYYKSLCEVMRSAFEPNGYKRRRVYCEYCDGDPNKMIEAGSPMVQCKLTEYMCLRPGVPNITLRYCDVKRSSRNTQRIDQYVAACRNKRCLYAFVFVDRDNRDRVSIYHEGLLYNGLLRVDKNLSVPIETPISPTDECRRWRDAASVNLTVMARPFCANCQGNIDSWKWALDADNKPAPLIECTFQQVKCPCYGATTGCTSDGAITHYTCSTVMKSRTAKPLEVLYPNLASYCENCRAIQISAFPIDGLWRLITDGVYIFPGISKVGDKNSKIITQNINANSICEPDESMCAGGRSFSVVTGSSNISIRNAPVVCTFCNGSVNVTQSTRFAVHCGIQRVDCPCFESFVVGGQKYKEKTANVCTIDHLAENEFQRDMKTWRDYCRSIDCIYAQVLTSGEKRKPYILYRNGIMYPGRVIEPRNEFVANPEVKRPEPYFLLPKEMHKDQYCKLLQVDKGLDGTKRHIAVPTPLIWQGRTVLTCSTCNTQPTTRYPSIGLEWIQCDLKKEQCDCNFGYLTTGKGICVEYLPYCDGNTITQETVATFKTSCQPDCQTFEVYDLQSQHIPLLVGGVLQPSRVVSPDASINMQQEVRKGDYCNSQYAFGLTKIPKGKNVTGYLMCSLCSDDPWGWMITTHLVACSIEKISCRCDGCKYVTPVAGSPVNHCLPVCNVGETTSYANWIRQCEEHNCKRPQVMYNSDWYLMATNVTIYPGVYKFRLYGSQRQVANSVSRQQYCTQYNYYTTLRSADEDDACSYSREFYQYPQWEQVYVACSMKSGRTLPQALCMNGQTRSIPPTNCRDQGGEVNVFAEPVLGEDGKTKRYGIPRSEYDRLLSTCRKAGYEKVMLATKAANMSYGKGCICSVRIFGTNEEMP